MNLVSQSEFARALGVSRQAISDAVKKNLITVRLDGKKKKVDIEDKKTTAYIKSNPPQRKNIIQKISQGKKTKQKPKKKGKKPIDKKTVKTEVKKKDKIETIINEELDDDNIGGDTSEDYEYSIIYLKARAEKEKETVIQKKLQNAKTRGELLDRDAVYTSIIMYLDKVHKNIERLSESYLSDVGTAIVTAGKVTPEIRDRWRSNVLEQIHDAKKTVVKKIGEIEKEQSG